MSNQYINNQSSADQQLNTAEWIDGLSIHIPRYDIEELKNQAVQHYAVHHEFKRSAANFTGNALNRITVNYLLHRHSEFRRYMSILSSKSKDEAMVARLKDRILKAIYSAYPHLITKKQ